MDSENDFLSQGMERLQTGEYEAALNFLEQAIVQNPQQPDTWYQKGLALQKLGRYVEAVKANQKFSTLTRALKKADKTSKKLKLSRSGETLQNSDLAQKWFEQGTQEFLLGHFESVLACYDKGLGLQPENSEGWYARGSLLANLCQYEEAIASYDKALAINPNYDDASSSRAVMLSQLNKYEEAIVNFDQALKVNPTNHYAWCNRGITLCDNLTRYEEAITSFEKALEVAPDFQEAWYNRGIAQSHLNRYEEAIASYDKALELKPYFYDDCFHSAWNRRGEAVLLSPAYSHFPALVIGATLSQHNPQLNQRGYPGQVITLELGLTQVIPHSGGWGDLQRALGEAHFGQGKLEQQLGHNPSLYWQKTRHCLDLALSVLSVEAFPELRLRTLQLMIRVLLAQGDNITAQSHRKDGAKVLHTLLNQAPNVFQKQQIEAKFSGFSQIEVDVWLQSGEPITALETAERFKNRCLTWILEAWKETVIFPNHAAIQSLCAPDTALIYWHLSSDSLSTFILTDKRNAPDILECNRTSQAQQLNTWMKVWNEDYRDYASKKFTGTDGENHTWRKNLVSRIDDLQRILKIATIYQQLPDTVQNLVLVSHRDLHLLPIHTLFCDYCCTYLPSVQIGLTLREQPSKNKTYTPLLSIEDPATEQPPMPFAQLESAIIRYLVKSATCIKGNDANINNVLKNVQESFGSFHFTGHGAYNSRTPADSALALTDGLLTAKAISQLDLSSYELIFLAACETALTGNDGIKTEYVGLASAFLKAGATNVLSTLWPVNEVPSCWFAIYFYQQLLQHQPPAIALYKTQQWLKTVTVAHLIQWIEELSQLPNLGYHWEKELKHEIQNLNGEKGKLDTDQPYAHPFYWAAFTLTGRGNLWVS